MDCTLIVCPKRKDNSCRLRQWVQMHQYFGQHLRPGNCSTVELGALVITHADTDHYGIVPEVLEGIMPGQIMRVKGSRNEYRSCKFETWLERHENDLSTPSEKLPEDFHDPQDSPNKTLDCGEAKIYVLAANVQSSKSKKNTESIVLRLSYGNFDVILTGDATEDTEDKILKLHGEEWLRSEVYKIPHHGSSTTSKNQALGVAARPRLAMTSNGPQK